MAEDSERRRDLLMRIEARRAGVQAFLRENRPRIRRRANITIVLTSLSAAFTAGPALGGETFAVSVQNGLGLSTDSLVWRVLCLLALVVSVAAAVLANIAKSQDADARLSTAEAAQRRAGGARDAAALRASVGGGRRQALPAVRRQDPLRGGPRADDAARPGPLVAGVSSRSLPGAGRPATPTPGPRVVRRTTTSSGRPRAPP